MNKVFIISLLLLISIICGIAQSYRILGIAAMPSHSHQVIGTTVLKELARKGHDVTVITPFPQKTPMKNYREIPIVEMVAAIDERKRNLFDHGKANPLMSLLFIFSMGGEMMEKVYKNPNVQKLLNSDERFDAVYMEYFLNDALMGIASHFKAPLIAISPMPASSWINSLVANPGNSANMPNMLTKMTGEMSFCQRVKNTLVDLAELAAREFLYLPGQKKILKKYLPHVPDLEEIRHNVSILLVNSHESVNAAVAHVPNMIPIGGFHIGPTKALPKDLKTYLDDAKEGVILFSMGSNLKSADMPPQLRGEILKALSKIKQSVLWKFEEQLEGLPSNVKIEKWLPQQDILAHPNVVAFITHGGLLSTTETIYFGKPIIGIPVFGDQSMNMARAVADGYAISIALDDLNEETLTNALNEIINNPKYKTEAQRRSAIMHDRPVKPLDLAVYWVEYAIGHKGAPHLRTVALKLKWYQNNSMDVYLFLWIIFAAVFALIVMSILFCCRRNKKTVSASKKKN